MLDKLTGKSVHYTIQLIAMIGIAAGLPFSKIPLSIGTMLLGLNVILLWDWKNVFKSWISNKWILLLLTYFLLVSVSVLWSENKHEAWNLLRREIPFYSIPMCIVAIPLKSIHHYKWVIIAFLSAVFLLSFINLGTYFHWWGNKDYDDIRSLSLFISHLRFAMMVVLAIVFCASWWIRKFPHRGISLLLAFWFLLYVNISQTGMGYFTLSGIVVLIFYFKVKSIQIIWLKRIYLLSFGISLLFVGIFLYIKLQPIPHKVVINNADYGSKTVNGHTYSFDLKENMIWENGYPVQSFIAEAELEKEWSKVSKINYLNGEDKKGNSIRNILWRYMTSKGLRKDSVDFQKMSREDIRNVEKGFASVEMSKGGITAQLYRMRGQLNGMIEDPNGKSLLEKVESLKAGVSIIKTNPIMGVGVGDLEASFQKAYIQNHSKLTVENQHLTHNQYLTSWISAGIVCFSVFLSLWIFQLFYALKINAFEWTGFLVITMLSFFIEDTLQTQTGIAFVAFFFAFFITGKNILYPQLQK